MGRDRVYSKSWWLGVDGIKIALGGPPDPIAVHVSNVPAWISQLSTTGSTDGRLQILGGD